ncbi:MAG TPA: signal recognition particle protein [Thermodesulfovibrio thiophilus]|uniref:signal recognition particle protein n=1 Tax=Thermodesulfovibrio thiophilus TaxID=340095 RepID=UPI00042A28AE|nr:signal recognition particle protein [Thermodesulfovibrio thiophilus]HHW20272.1 signal recognition particle protein [Thermodesulfovibrio thiophilus]HOA82602.1 signal recognition particle protein [Thermodesulfovibrio thiophilus]HQA03383.1 signal recognition particle protein [Thermodesulfovibrio thiophilus]HQD37033.1 signal recognition particle protein [Thermodesulfovibrio thiophilus]
MFEALTDKFEIIFKKLKGKGILKEDDVDVALKEIRIALLEADVNFKVVKSFIERVRQKAIGKEILESLSPAQQVIKIVYDELCELLGGSSSKIQLNANPPTVIMMVGLHGSGKTTTSAKLARIFKKQGRRPMLVAADLQRPAAIDQLVTLGKQIDIPVFHSYEIKDPRELCREALKKSVIDRMDPVIVDTAGRMHVDEDLMKELQDVREILQPKEVLFVADAMTGQDAVNIAKSFNEKIGIDGVILTKMDGDARGGAALSIKEVTGKPIKFIGTGEKIDALEEFYPDRMAKRILGMGDVLTLIEQAQQAYDQKEAEKLKTKIEKNEFSFDDLKEQIRKMRKMGPLENILSMIPGANKMLKNIKIDEKEFIRVEAIINSMTLEERTNPKILNASRRIRIAKGSGTTVTEVNRLIKQFNEMRKLMKQMKHGKGLKLPKIFPF